MRFRRIRSALLQCLPAIFLGMAAGSGWAQATANPELEARDFTSLQALVGACTALPQHTCTVDADTSQTWSLGGRVQLPTSLHLRFTAGGRWTLHGGTLDFGGANIEAPADARIFAGDGSVSGLAEARPEWFAAAENGVYPPAALAAAFDATVVNGTILLNQADYVSPFSGIAVTGHSGDKTRTYDSPRLLLGAGRPTPDQAIPTRLQHGTIILGPFIGTAALRAAHLGFDNGAEIASRYFAGQEGFGLVLYSTGKLGVVKGSDLEDIAVLSNGVRDQHSVLIEGQSHVAVNGLWVWTLGGAHGLIIKSSDVTVHDFHCKGAANDCLLIKSDFFTDRAGYAANILVDGADISFLTRPGDTGGIVVDSRWDAVRSLTLRNISENGLTYGLAAGGSFFHTFDGLTIESWRAQNLSGPCLATEYTRNVVIQNFACSVQAAPIAAAFFLDGSNFTLQDGTIACTGTPATCAQAATNGIASIADNVRLDNIQAQRLGGFVLRTNRVADTGARNLSTREMQNGLLAPYIAPHVTLRERWLEFKPYLRILWTMLAVRIRGVSLVERLIVAAVAIVLAVTVSGRRRRARRL